MNEGDGALDVSCEAFAEAIENGEVDEVKLLLEAGVLPRGRASKGRHQGVPPLAIAARGAKPADILHLLLEVTADTEATGDVVSIHDVTCEMEVTRRLGRDEEIFAALMAWTDTFVDVDVHRAQVITKLNLLLAHGVDVNARVEHSGDTALHVVARIFQRNRSQLTGPSANNWTQRRFNCAKFKWELLQRAGAEPLRNRRHELPIDLVSSDLRGELSGP
uniref:Ankyrin repeat protein n=1 Tax=Noctiluca scintillans TaxID=2966 RepID=A0A7S1F430_NOCSC